MTAAIMTRPVARATGAGMNPEYWCPPCRGFHAGPCTSVAHRQLGDLLARMVHEADSRVPTTRRARRTLQEMLPGYERQPVLTLHRPVMAGDSCPLCGKWNCDPSKCPPGVSARRAAQQLAVRRVRWRLRCRTAADGHAEHAAGAYGVDVRRLPGPRALNAAPHTRGPGSAALRGPGRLPRRHRPPPDPLAARGRRCGRRRSVGGRTPRRRPPPAPPAPRKSTACLTPCTSATWRPSPPTRTTAPPAPIPRARTSAAALRGSGWGRCSSGARTPTSNASAASATPAEPSRSADTATSVGCLPRPSRLPPGGRDGRGEGSRTARHTSGGSRHAQEDA